jgi:hypothetical protein
MGLDVYLYHYKKPFAEVKKLEKEAEEACEVFTKKKLEEFGVKDWKELTDEQKKVYWKEKGAFYSERGLDKYGSVGDDVREEIEIPSSVFPDHMFKIGYLRSSYNAGGIDHVMRDRIGETLRSLFGNNDDSYEFSPDWGESLKRIRGAITKWEEYIEKNGCYYVDEISPVVDCQEINNQAKALEVFLEQRKLHAKDPPDKLFSGSYMNGRGHFHLGQPIQVVALIPGRAEFFGGPATYVVYKCSDEGNNANMKWYLDALRITAEMCEWVLGKPDPEMYVMHWSG